MTQEHKELLIKELCGRLPYGVKFRYKYIDECFHEKYGTSTLDGVIPPYRIIHSTLTGNEYLRIEEDDIKPYLFPLSSMTEEQKKELFYLSGIDIIYGKFYTNNEFTLEETLSGINLLLKNHFDINGLIQMGLGIDATNLNVY